MSEAQAIIDVLTGQRRSPGQRGGTGEVSASFVADCAVAEHVSQLPQRQSSAKWQHSPTHLPVWKFVTTTQNELWMFTAGGPLHRTRSVSPAGAHTSGKQTDDK